MIFPITKRGKSEELWLEDDSQVEWRPSFREWRGLNHSKTVVSYVQEWIAASASRPTGITASENDNSWNEINQRIDEVDRFALRFEFNSSASIANKLIHTLEMDGGGSIILVNCVVKHLEFRQVASLDVRLENCRIGTLRFHKHSVGTFEMIGRSVRKLFAPTPTESSPFIGSVEVRGSRFSAAFENAQAYRNLRHHLTTLHNHEAASVFHAAEMEAEAGKQTIVDKLISFLYRALSNYGGSSARPLAIFAALVILNFLFIYVTDGVILIGEINESDGWRFDMYGMDESARVLRSAVFALNQSFNPFGIFGTRLLLTAKTPIIATTSLLLGIASTFAFALFFLAVRRRFRLDRGS